MLSITAEAEVRGETGGHEAGSQLSVLHLSDVIKRSLFLFVLIWLLSKFC